MIGYQRNNVTHFIPYDRPIRSFLSLFHSLVPFSQFRSFKFPIYSFWSRDRAVTIVTALRDGKYRVRIPENVTFFLFPRCQYRHRSSPSLILNGYRVHSGDRGGTVVKALCYKSEGRWFDSRWCHWNFSLT